MDGGTGGAELRITNYDGQDARRSRVGRTRGEREGRLDKMREHFARRALRQWGAEASMLQSL